MDQKLDVQLVEKVVDVTGTVLVAFLLPSGVAMGGDARVTSVTDSMIKHPECKIFEIRKNPPIVASWSHSSPEGKEFMAYLKTNARNRTIHQLVEDGTSHLKEINRKFDIQCFVCSVVNGEPIGYIVSRFCDTKHDKGCKGKFRASVKCSCEGFYIDCHNRPLGIGVHCIGSGNKSAYTSLKMNFKGRENYRRSTQEWNIEELKLNGCPKLERAHVPVLQAMLFASFKNESCGSPFLVSTISTGGEINARLARSFWSSYKEFFPSYDESHATTIFLIYHRPPEGSDYGKIVVKNLIPPQVVRASGFSVAELPGDRVLHFVTLTRERDVDELWSDFDSIWLMENPDIVDEFCRDKGSLRFSKLDLSNHRDNKHGVDVVNDFEFVFLVRRCEEFLDSLIFDETYTEAVNSEALGF
ncbi:hypothetical protein EV1_028345 [Malus domestica]|nr:uncharacterized protein LOC103421614 [Malus domestica]XP_028952598.1 uncharacterized protein LOC103421614 [Malus domestica]